MSVDGLANFYMDDPAAEMPTIRKLAAEGAKAASMRASDPTVTWPNHTTLVTGVSPALHGVVGNNYFDRVKGEKVTLIWDPVLDKDADRESAHDLRSGESGRTEDGCHSLAGDAQRACARLDQPGCRRGRARPASTPRRRCSRSAKRLGFMLTQSPTARAKSARNLAGKHCRGRHVDAGLQHDSAQASAQPGAACTSWRSITPSTPTARDRPSAYEAIKAADGQVRQVWEQLQKDFPGKATLIIVSDHGFSANKTAVLPNVVLKEKGLVEVKGKKVTGGAVQIVPQGGSALVYIWTKPIAIRSSSRSRRRSPVSKAFRA